MAFPAIAASNSTVVGTATSTHVYNLPASISSGDLLLLFAQTDFDVVTFTTPSGWTQLFNTVYSGGSNYRTACWYKVASGSEGSTVSVSTSGNTRSKSISYRITGYQGVPECGTIATGTSTNANPPSLSPSWSTADTLWIAMASSNGSTISGAPSSYGNLIQKTGNFFTLATADRSINGATEDPGAFTSASAQWIAQTIAIRPVTASAYSLTADGTSYSLTGKATTMFKGSKVFAGVGSYTLSGQVVSVKRTARLVVGATSYTYTGQTVGLLRTARLAPVAGSYAFVGKDLLLARGKVVNGGLGSFVYSGLDVDFHRTFRIDPVVGVYLVEGQLVGLLRTTRLDPAAGTYRLNGQDVQLTWGQSPFWQPGGAGGGGGWSSSSGLTGSWTKADEVAGDWTPEGEGN